MRINLNADLGESFGAWTMGQDADLLGIVGAANIACGFHAGDPLVMRRTVRTALRRNGALDEVDVSETREELVIRIPWPAVGRVARVLAKTRLPVAR